MYLEVFKSLSLEYIIYKTYLRSVLWKKRLFKYVVLNKLPVFICNNNVQAHEQFQITSPYRVPFYRFIDVPHTVFYYITKKNAITVEYQYYNSILVFLYGVVENLVCWYWAAATATATTAATATATATTAATATATTVATVKLEAQGCY